MLETAEAARAETRGLGLGLGVKGVKPDSANLHCFDTGAAAPRPLYSVRTLPSEAHPQRPSHVPANPTMRSASLPMPGQEHTPLMDEKERKEILERRARATEMVLRETQLWQVLTR